MGVLWGEGGCAGASLVVEHGLRACGLSGCGTRAYLAVAWGLSCPTECGVSTPHPGLEPAFPVFESRLLTTGPLGTSHGCFMRHLLDISVVAMGIPLTNIAQQGRELANRGPSCHALNPFAAFLPRPHFWWAAVSQQPVQHDTKAGSSLGSTRHSSDGWLWPKASSRVFWRLP